MLEKFKLLATCTLSFFLEKTSRVEGGFAELKFKAEQNPTLGEATGSWWAGSTTEKSIGQTDRPKVRSRAGGNLVSKMSILMI